MSHYACMVSLYMIYRLDFPVIVITFSSRYCQTYRTSYFNALLVMLLPFHILSFCYSFPSCTLAGLLLTDLYYFSIFRSESRYRELIVEHILVQLFSDEFSFFSWIVLFRYGGWYCLCSVFHICAFIHALGCICIYVCYPARCWQPKVLMEEISLFVSIC